MSFNALRWAFQQPVAKQGQIRDALKEGRPPPGLSSSESLVLIRLADHHNGETGLCFPTMRTLAAETGYSETTVEKAIGVLRDCKLVELDPSARPARVTRGAERPVNGYRLRTTHWYGRSPVHPTQWGGSMPLSGVVPPQSLAHNQETNQEVPASPTHGTEPGRKERAESGTNGFRVPDQDRPLGGLPGLRLHQVEP